MADPESDGNYVVPSGMSPPMPYAGGNFNAVLVQRPGQNPEADFDFAVLQATQALQRSRDTRQPMPPGDLATVLSVLAHVAPGIAFSDEVDWKMQNVASDVYTQAINSAEQQVANSAGQLVLMMQAQAMQGQRELDGRLEELVEYVEKNQGDRFHALWENVCSYNADQLQAQIANVRGEFLALAQRRDREQALVVRSQMNHTESLVRGALAEQHSALMDAFTGYTDSALEANQAETRAAVLQVEARAFARAVDLANTARTRAVSVSNETGAANVALTTSLTGQLDHRVDELAEQLARLKTVTATGVQRAELNKQLGRFQRDTDALSARVDELTASGNASDIRAAIEAATDRSREAKDAALKATSVCDIIAKRLDAESESSKRLASKLRAALEKLERVHSPVGRSDLDRSVQAAITDALAPVNSSLSALSSKISRLEARPASQPSVLDEAKVLLAITDALAPITDSLSAISSKVARLETRPASQPSGLTDATVQAAITEALAPVTAALSKISSRMTQLEARPISQPSGLDETTIRRVVESIVEPLTSELRTVRHDLRAQTEDTRALADIVHRLQAGMAEDRSKVADLQAAFKHVTRSAKHSALGRTSHADASETPRGEGGVACRLRSQDVPAAAGTTDTAANSAGRGAHSQRTGLPSGTQHRARAPLHVDSTDDDDTDAHGSDGGGSGDGGDGAGSLHFGSTIDGESAGRASGKKHHPAAFAIPADFVDVADGWDALMNVGDWVWKDYIPTVAMVRGKLRSAKVSSERLEKELAKLSLAAEHVYVRRDVGRTRSDLVNVSKALWACRARFDQIDSGISFETMMAEFEKFMSKFGDQVPSNQIYTTERAKLISKLTSDSRTKHHPKRGQGAKAAGKPAPAGDSKSKGGNASGTKTN